MAKKKEVKPLLRTAVLAKLRKMQEDLKRVRQDIDDLQETYPIIDGVLISIDDAVREALKGNYDESIGIDGLIEKLK